MKYVAGLDGGGTKTTVELRTIDNKFIARESFGAMNLNGHTKEDVKKTIADCISYIKGYNLNDCLSMCIGSAGVNNPEAESFIKNAVNECGYKNKLVLFGDYQTALAGAIDGNNGVIIIAGTGSICYGTGDNNAEFRCGGWGHIIGDEGSGYAIGRDIISTVMRALDKRDASTALSKMLYNKLNINNERELIKFVYSASTNKQQIASLAVLADDAAKVGDATALKILNTAAYELSLLAICTLKSLNLSKCSVAMMGSVLSKNKIVQNEFVRLVQNEFKDIKCINPINDAATGAAFLALKNRA